MNRVKTEITKLDPYPGTSSIFWNGIQDKKTLLGGVLGLIFILMTLGLIINKSIITVGRKELTLDSFIKRDLSKVVMGENSVYLVFTWMHKVDPDDDEYVIDIVDPNDLPKMGLNAYTLETAFNYSSRHDGSNITLVEMSKCTDPKKDIFLCAPGISFEPECSLEASDTKACSYLKEYYVMVLPCDKRKYK